MTIEELERIMVEHGATIRAIPKVIVGVYEKRHIDKYPDGRIEYFDSFKREMLVTESAPKNAGKFLLKSKCGTGCMVEFERKFYDSIEQAVADLQATVAE